MSNIDSIMKIHPRNALAIVFTILMLFYPGLYKMWAFNHDYFIHINIFTILIIALMKSLPFVIASFMILGLANVITEAYSNENKYEDVMAATLLVSNICLSGSLFITIVINDIFKLSNFSFNYTLGTITLMINIIISYILGIARKHKPRKNN